MAQKFKQSFLKFYNFNIPGQLALGPSFLPLFLPSQPRPWWIHHQFPEGAECRLQRNRSTTTGVAGEARQLGTGGGPCLWHRPRSLWAVPWACEGARPLGGSTQRKTGALPERPPAVLPPQLISQKEFCPERQTVWFQRCTARLHPTPIVLESEPRSVSKSPWHSHPSHRTQAKASQATQMWTQRWGIHRCLQEQEWLILQLILGTRHVLTPFYQIHHTVLEVGGKRRTKCFLLPKINGDMILDVSWKWWKVFPIWWWRMWHRQNVRIWHKPGSTDLVNYEDWVYEGTYQCSPNTHHQ